MSYLHVAYLSTKSCGDAISVCCVFASKSCDLLRSQCRFKLLFRCWGFAFKILVAPWNHYVRPLYLLQWGPTLKKFGTVLWQILTLFLLLCCALHLILLFVWQVLNLVFLVQLALVCIAANTMLNILLKNIVRGKWGGSHSCSCQRTCKEQLFG